MSLLSREMLLAFSFALIIKVLPLVNAEAENDPCLEAADPGPCQYYSVKWFWDQQDETCKEFHYGGCLGTKNRFNSKQQCIKQCVYKTHNPATIPEVCLLDANPGHCNDDRNGLWFWYFNSDKGECAKFFYYGCGGNDNRFYSVYSCQKVCGERLAPRAACDRCDSRTSFCKAHAKYNYTCECRRGFAKNKHDECVDEDECRTFEATCDKNAWCHNSIGSYRCECMAGYRGEGKHCTYVGLGRSTLDCTKCHKDATCNQGVCECKIGFIGDGLNCSDVDECLRSPYVCDVNAECDNTLGSYLCRCLPGYAGNGFNCTKTKNACLDKFDRNYAEQCSGENWREHYFLDHDTKRCSLFWYDGCRGTSRNIFSNLDTCEQMCEMTNVLTRSQICWDNFDVNYRNQCAAGSWEQRYYFDHASLTCKMFWYDQCRGTSRNLFDDMLTCQWMCEEQPMYKAKSCLEPFDEHYRDECNGGRWRQLYYFDKVEKNCRSFWYDGCTGESQNIYSDEITCQALCENPVKTDPHKPWHHKDKHKEIEMVHNIHQFDPCAPKPCKNGGTCRSTTNTKTQEITFECTCSPGYSGEACDSQPCEVNPCFNNGTCATSKGLSTFYCNCPLEFAGKLCDIVIGETKPKYGSKVTQLSSGKVEWIEKLKKTYAAQSTEPSSKTPTKSTDKPMKETVKIKATFKSLNVTEGMNSSSIVLNDGEMNEFDEPAAMKQAQTQMESDIKGTGGVLDMKNSGGIPIANGLALCMIHVCCMFICRIW